MFIDFQNRFIFFEKIAKKIKFDNFFVVFRHLKCDMFKI